MQKNFKKYAVIVLASTVVIGGIATAAITPIPTISNTFAVTGQAVTAAGMNTLAEALNILDARTNGSQDFDFGTKKGVNLAPPSANTDAATKQYVDGAVAAAGTGGAGLVGEGGERCTAEVLTGKKIIELDLYRDRVCALTDTGFVYCWGNNSNGSLGVEGLYRLCPTLVPGLSGVVEIEGQYVRMSDGTLKKIEHETIIDIPGISGVASLYNLYFSDFCAVKTDGTVWCWGPNSANHRGLGNNTSSEFPTVQNTAAGSAVSTLAAINQGTISVALKTDGTLRYWGKVGSTYLNGANISGISGVTDIFTSVYSGVSIYAATPSGIKEISFNATTGAPTVSDVSSTYPNALFILPFHHASSGLPYFVTSDKKIQSSLSNNDIMRKLGTLDSPRQYVSNKRYNNTDAFECAALNGGMDVYCSSFASTSLHDANMMGYSSSIYAVPANSPVRIR